MKKIFLFLSIILLTGCQNQPKLKSFNNVITADDSLNIELSKADILTYHSDKLGLDITYPSYLRHQFLEDEQMEVFLNDDLSLSFMEQRLYKGDDIFRTPGQQLMGMGAELLEAGDDYSLHTGQDGDFEYYAKVIDDSTRIVTIILRYLPDRAGAAEGLKQYVHNYVLNPNTKHPLP
jgi:hypothetical protein